MFLYIFCSIVCGFAKRIPGQKLMLFGWTWHGKVWESLDSTQSWNQLLHLKKLADAKISTLLCRSDDAPHSPIHPHIHRHEGLSYLCNVNMKCMDNWYWQNLQTYLMQCDKVIFVCLQTYSLNFIIIYFRSYCFINLLFFSFSVFNTIFLIIVTFNFHILYFLTLTISNHILILFFSLIFSVCIFFPHVFSYISRFLSFPCVLFAFDSFQVVKWQREKGSGREPGERAFTPSLHQDPRSKSGKSLFIIFGCSICHINYLMKPATEYFYYQFYQDQSSKGMKEILKTG